MNASHRFAPCLAGLLLMSSAWAAETRPPNAQELAAFQAFHAKRHPGAPAAQPVFAITRPDARSPWSVNAAIDSAPRRGLRTLCRMERSDFKFDKRWSAAERVRQFVWLDARTCSAGAQAVELLHRMPDSEVLPLLAGQAAALPKARLIMAGNSACAGVRSAPFRFAAIDVGPGGASAEEMAGLVYRGDNSAQVTVWVRKRAGGLDNWNVSCPPRQPPRP